MLTPREQIELQEIERQLIADDPRFAARLGRGRPPRRGRVVAVVAMITAVVLIGFIAGRAWASTLLATSLIVGLFAYFGRSPR